MTQTTSEIYKKVFPSLILYLVLIAGFNLLMNAMGLGSDAFMDPIQPGQVKPEFHITGLSYLSIALQIVYFIVVGLMGFGITLSIYRVARYGADIGVVDMFYFFNHYAGKTILTVILQSVLTAIGFIVLIVPGIIFSLAMTPLGAVVGLEQLQGRSEAFEPIKKSWRATKGHKGMIFGRLVVAGIIIVVLAVIASFASLSIGASGGAFSNVIQAVLTIVSGLVTYFALVDVLRELVERGAFSEWEDDRDEVMDEGEL
ncbi:MAG: hypothetical protein SPI65_04415 [Peptoniphilus sp.]|nr:hypothetical protein [Peptoniphilus sp.]MDD7363488.1 hypothetical protein [Bacillota bacterium]MDY6044808.1 hypothetical protein [Peptoniphilus sp.]